jgi:NADH:ubiquinone oxidoreductase subunit F (NADH-binding)
MFSVSGDVQRPGVFEVENGITVRELLETAGGVRGGQSLLAIALSGPSGGFTPAVLPRASWPRKVQKLLPESMQQVELLDLQMHINYFRVWDLMLGAGIVVYAADANLMDQALACLRFFQAESCGKCVPCRVGSTKLAQIGADLAAGKLNDQQIADLQREGGAVADLAFAMASTAICGLGTVAPNPLTTLLKHFPSVVTSCQLVTDKP